MSTAPSSPRSSAAPMRATQRSAAEVPPASPPGIKRPKRSQVSRACDWCRVHRVKCDTAQPCNNCRSRGAQCSATGANEIRNLPHAFREIERLRSRVQELEQEIERRDRAAGTAGFLSEPSTEASPGPQPVLSASAAPTPHLSEEEFWRENAWGQRARGEGLYTGDDRAKQWFGPSSLFYFIGRMTLHLARFIEYPPPEHTIHWAPSQSFTSTTLDTPDISMHESMEQDPQAGSAPYLTGLQEEYFICFFWQSYNCSLQIMDESSFKELYNSLWADNCRTRKQSALVDIVIALCIQYDTALPLRRSASYKSSTTDPDTKDTAIAGRYYYQRCQSLLLAELECPTISTLQCHIFCVYYLCCASFQNMAHSTLALAVRTAHILGLHLEPPEDMPRPERELRKRLWWTLYSLESKTCIKLGRPWSAPMSDTTCSLPADDHQLAIQSGSAVLAGGNVTWLTYTLQSTKLVLAVRNIYVSFWHEFARVLSTPGGPSSIYEDPAVLEGLAIFLQSSIATYLELWVHQVPDAMRCKRKAADDSSATLAANTAFSTADSELEIEAFAPLWLQRQRVFLELLYHNLSLILYRPLVSFTANHTPNHATTACSEACVSHAITLTRMTHQAISETDILKGCHEAFQWQWNAAITMIGFYLAAPMSPQAACARAAIDTAIEVFEIFGKHFAVGSRAARVVGDLTAKTDFLLGIGIPQQGEGFLGSGGVAAAAADTGSEAAEGLWGGGAKNGEAMVADGGLMQDGARLQDVLSGTMGVAFSVDSFNSFEAFHGNGFSFSDSLVFPSE